MYNQDGQAERQNNCQGYWTILGVLLLLWLMPAQRVSCAWSPPAGIPSPPFGIEEPTYESSSHCPNWPGKQNSKKQGARFDCYYVDNSAPCNDGNAGGYGTPQAPLCNIPQGQFTAGAYVDVRGGREIPYTSTWVNRFHFWGTGTARDYIVISGKRAKGGKPIINKYVHIGGEDGKSSYLILENFETRFSVDIRPTIDGYHQQYISIRNNTMRGAGYFKSGEEFIVGVDKKHLFPNTTISNIVFYNNESSDAGKWDAEREDDTCSFYVQGGVSNVWVVDNLAYRSGGDGIAGGHSADRTSDHYYIGRNTLYQHRENCIDVKEINDLIISENVCSSLSTPADVSANGEGIVVHYGANSKGPNNSWVLYNTIHDVINGIQINSTNGAAYVIGNRIYAVHHDDAGWKPASPYSNGAGIRIYSMQESVIANNIIYDYDTGLQFPNPSSDQTYIVSGNIISNRTNPAGYEALVPTGQSNISLANNHFYNPGGQARFGWGSSSYVGLKNIDCENCTEKDPLFTSPPADFHLRPDSPASTSENRTGVYQKFYETYGIRIGKDQGPAGYSR